MSEDSHSSGRPAPEKRMSDLLNNKMAKPSRGRAAKPLRMISDLKGTLSGRLRAGSSSENEADYSMGIPGLDPYGYEKYNVDGEQEIYISKIPESAFFDETEPRMVRATDGNSVGSIPRVGRTEDRSSVSSKVSDLKDLFPGVLRGSGTLTVLKSKKGVVQDNEIVDYVPVRRSNSKINATQTDRLLKSLKNSKDVMKESAKAGILGKIAHASRSKPVNAPKRMEIIDDDYGYEDMQPVETEANVATASVAVEVPRFVEINLAEEEVPEVAVPEETIEETVVPVETEEPEEEYIVTADAEVQEETVVEIDETEPAEPEEPESEEDDIPIFGSGSTVALEEETEGSEGGVVIAELPADEIVAEAEDVCVEEVSSVEEYEDDVPAVPVEVVAVLPTMSEEPEVAEEVPVEAAAEEYEEAVETIEAVEEAVPASEPVNFDISPEMSESIATYLGAVAVIEASEPDESVFVAPAAEPDNFDISPEMSDSISIYLSDVAAIEASEPDESVFVAPAAEPDNFDISPEMSDPISIYLSDVAAIEASEPDESVFVAPVAEPDNFDISPELTGSIAAYFGSMEAIAASGSAEDDKVEMELDSVEAVPSYESPSTVVAEPVHTASSDDLVVDIAGPVDVDEEPASEVVAGLSKIEVPDMEPAEPQVNADSIEGLYLEGREKTEGAVTDVSMLSTPETAAAAPTSSESCESPNATRIELDRSGASILPPITMKPVHKPAVRFKYVNGVMQKVVEEPKNESEEGPRGPFEVPAGVTVSEPAAVAEPEEEWTEEEMTPSWASAGSDEWEVDTSCGEITDDVMESLAFDLNPPVCISTLEESMAIFYPEMAEEFDWSVEAFPDDSLEAVCFCEPAVFLVPETPTMIGAAEQPVLIGSSGSVEMIASSEAPVLIAPAQQAAVIGAPVQREEPSRNGVCFSFGNNASGKGSVFFSF